jgi:exosortase
MTARREPAWALALAGGALWIVLWHSLAAHWSANAQYSYGWLVPLAQLFLVRCRAATRPAPAPSGNWARALVIGVALLLLPTWLVLQPNPDWVLINWVFAMEVVALTLGIVALLGGVAWAWHFAFPIALVLAAVPWPSALEQPLVQGLMQSVAGVTVELLNLFGIPALQHSNLIQIGKGLLGVDEACSGVRSLQATLMATLFFGEFYRFPFGVRAALVVIGFAAAFLTNVARTLFLAVTAMRHGLDAVTRWHDPAGFSILAACLIIVWIFALLFLRHHREPAAAATVAPPPANPAPRWIGITLGAWLLVILVATEWWYGHDDARPQSAWTVVPPPESHPEPIAPQTAELLHADQSLSAAWREPGGAQWQLFFFEWRPGPSRSRILARMHRPEVCLPAAGLRQFGEPLTLTIDAAGTQLPFQATQYRAGASAPLYVYFCAWENRSAHPGQPATFTSALRWESLQPVWRRERNLGQQVVELILTGYPTPEEADAAFRREIPRLIRRTELN